MCPTYSCLYGGHVGITEPHWIQRSGFYFPSRVRLIKCDLHSSEPRTNVEYLKAAWKVARQSMCKWQRGHLLAHSFQIGFRVPTNRNHPIRPSFELFKRLHERRCWVLSINAGSVVMPPSAVRPAGLQHKKKQMEKHTTFCPEPEARV